MKSIGISNFLEEISSLSHSAIFLYFFALIAEEAFFFNLSLLFFGTLHSTGNIFPFLLCFLLLFFSQLFVRPPQTVILLFCISFRICQHALNMPANLKNSAVATGLEKVSFHSNPKERQRQRMLKLPHNCTHLTC